MENNEGKQEKHPRKSKKHRGKHAETPEETIGSS